MKSKLITTMMTVLFLAFAVIALPLLSVPTVSAKTLKGTFWEWCSDVMPSPPFDPFTPLGDALLMVGRMEGGISADMYAWSTPKIGTVGPHLKPEPSKTFHWHQDLLIVFDDGRWIIGWVDGVWPPNTMWLSFEGRITGASSDKTNYIGCKISGKCFSIWWPDPLPDGISPQWGEWGVTTWGYTEGTLSLSG